MSTIVNSSAKISIREIIFQALIYLLVFIFYSFDKYSPNIEPFEFAFFCNYTLATLVISYLLLPHFYYPKKYIPFFIGVVLIIAAVICVEEMVLEPIYFPNDRGKHFPGIVFTLVQIMPMLTILLSFKFAWDALYKQRELDELKAAAQESELQFLKSQVNPHFLFNNLNNLYAYAIEQSPKTPEIILELSAVLRYMLYECRAAYVPLSKEIEQLENFTRLSQLQIEERGEVHFQKTGSTNGLQIAPLILIVFIENAFKHSQSSLSDKILIDIEVEIHDSGRLAFRCVNNYQAQSNHDNISHGIGLENVRKRLELIYPGQYNLQIKERDDWYEVNLSIQLNKPS